MKPNYYSGQAHSNFIKKMNETVRHRKQNPSLPPSPGIHQFYNLSFLGLAINNYIAFMNRKNDSIICRYSSLFSRKKQNGKHYKPSLITVEKIFLNYGPANVISPSLSIYFFLIRPLFKFFFFFLGPDLEHTEVPRLGIKSELQL